MASTGTTILILTQDFDPMADRLVVELGLRGAACVRWHLDGLPSASTLSICFGSGGATARFQCGDRLVDADEIGSVWNRRPAPFKLPEALRADERLFAEREIQAAIYGFVRMRDWFWVNHPDVNRRGACKALQLRTAQELGMAVPRTLISNDPSEVRRFVAQSAGGIVYKTLRSPFIGESPRACFTSFVTEEQLAHLELIRVTGGIFQEYVPKQLELRVIVIGKRVFAAEIHSQDSDAAKVDWRRTDATALKHAVHTLPAEIERLCQRFIEGFDLNYGAMDFILTPDGRYVFLENNPSGQYGWIEDLTGLPLTATLAELLIAQRGA